MGDPLYWIKLGRELGALINEQVFIAIIFSLAGLGLFYKYMFKPYKGRTEQVIDEIKSTNEDRKQAIINTFDEKVKTVSELFAERLDNSHKHLEIIFGAVKEMLLEHIGNEEKTLEKIAKQVEHNNTQLIALGVKLPDARIDDLEKIFEVIRKSAFSVSKVVVDYVSECKFGGTPVDASKETAVNLAVQDVEKDRKLYHAKLNTEGVKPMLIEIWEACEAKLFKSFAYSIQELVDDLNGFHGNGHTRKYFEKSRESFENYLYSTFVTELKSMVVNN